MPFPNDLQAKVQGLIAQHRRLKDQTLLLALYYAREDVPDGVYLLEVISPFGHNEVSYDKDLFEIEYGSTPGFPLPTGRLLHILLTNAVEGRAAAEQRWPAIIPVLDAVRRGQYQVLHEEAEGAALLSVFQEDRVAA